MVGFLSAGPPAFSPEEGGSLFEWMKVHIIYKNQVMISGKMSSIIALLKIIST